MLASLGSGVEGTEHAQALGVDAVAARLAAVMTDDVDLSQALSCRLHVVGEDGSKASLERYAEVIVGSILDLAGFDDWSDLDHYHTIRNRIRDMYAGVEIPAS